MRAEERGEATDGGGRRSRKAVTEKAAAGIDIVENDVLLPRGFFFCAISTDINVRGKREHTQSTKICLRF